MRIGRYAPVLVAAGLVLAALAMDVPTAMAQGATRESAAVGRVQAQRRIPRITVVPLSRYHRQCDFWLAVEHRPSGDVITPQQHCWWALR